jgi:hypothetical protein
MEGTGVEQEARCRMDVTTAGALEGELRNFEED